MSAHAHDPPAWEFAIAPPHSAPGVSSMVGYRALAVADTLHRGLPSSRLTFIVSLDAGVEAAATEHGLEHATPNPVVLGGLHTVASYVRQRPAQAGVQLSLHPLAARTVLGTPAAELPTTGFDGVSFLGRWAAELHDRLTEENDWPTLFRMVSDHLVRRHTAGERTRTDRVRPELLHTWHLLERSRGRVPVSALAAAVDLSTRRLGVLFQRELGRSPKQIAGLMRFEHATRSVARQVAGSGRADLAATAAESGYSDQAHLSREFVRYAGTSPRTWIAEEFRNIQDGGHGATGDWDHD